MRRELIRVMAGALVLLVSITWAAPDQHTRHVELALGQHSIDGTGDEVDDSGSAYAVALDSRIGEHGYFSGHVRAARVANFDDSELGAYCLDAVVRLNFRPDARLRFYMGGGLGGVWTDARAVEAEDGSETRVTGDSFLQWNGVAGARFFFSTTARMGVGAEYRMAAPLDRESVDYDRTRESSIYLILPAGPAGG